MPSFIRNPKDFWSGVIYVLFGLAAVLIGQDYAMGTAGRMGPAYFPTILGSLLAIVGLIAIVRSMFSVGAAVEKFWIREALVITVAVLLFGVLVRGAGLVPAVLVLILLSAYASVKFRLLPSVLLAAGLAVFSVLVFVKALGLPMPVFGPWLGF
ncbi:MAG: tripartite tricarboxylate transporter TctB family protein [Noviherbaspirillum sp.]